MSSQTARPDAGRALRVGVMSFAHLHAAGFASVLQARPDVDLLCADPDSVTAPPDEVRGAELAADLGVAYV
jgi:1,5-anhydro-D-fructose reductase (1,5-anhydro-D-mannitol-forming)